MVDLSAILSKYSIIISFLAGLVTGEEVILILSFLSANELLPLWQIFIFAGLGVFLSDIIVYFIGSTKFVRYFFKQWKIAKAYRRFERAVEKISHNRIFLLLLVTKFIYGTRVLTLLYLGVKKVPHKKFIIYDFIVVFTYLIPVVILGWLAGSGFKFIMTVFKSIQIGLLLLVIAVIVFIIIREWTSVELIEAQKQLNNKKTK